MPKFIKKPVAIEAIQWTGKNLIEVVTFIESEKPDLTCDAAKGAWAGYTNYVAENGLVISTLEGDMKASVDDYIIKGVKGELYPCKPDIFKATYYTEQEYAEL